MENEKMIWSIIALILSIISLIYTIFISPYIRNRKSKYEKNIESMEKFVDRIGKITNKKH